LKYLTEADDYSHECAQIGVGHGASGQEHHRGLTAGLQRGQAAR